MALLIFNNGTVSTAVKSSKSSYLAASPSIKHLDFTMPPIERKHREEKGHDQKENAVYRKPVLPKKKVPVASPSQKLSYVNAGNVDSLENRRRLKASHVMSSPVITAMSHELVFNAKKIMQEHDISHVVIVNKDNNPLGLITAKELLAVESPQSSFLQSILNPNTLAVSEDTLVRDIALNFMKYKATAITVVDADHKLIGIISRSDLMSLLVSGPNQQIRA